MSNTGWSGAMASGSATVSRVPSVCSTSTSWPATPASGCSTTKPTRFTLSFAVALASASNRKPASSAVMVARQTTAPAGRVALDR